MRGAVPLRNATIPRAVKRSPEYAPEAFLLTQPPVRFAGNERGEKPPHLSGVTSASPVSTIFTRRVRVVPTRSPVTLSSLARTTAQHSEQPFAELRIHPTEHIPAAEPLGTHRNVHAPKHPPREEGFTQYACASTTTTMPTALAIRTSSTPSSRTEVPSNSSVRRTCARRCLTSCKTLKASSRRCPQVRPQKIALHPQAKRPKTHLWAKTLT